MNKTWSAILMSACLGACSGDGGGDQPSDRADARRLGGSDAPSGGGTPDAAPMGGGADGAVSMGCKAQMDYGDMGSPMAKAASVTSTFGNYLYLNAALNMDPDSVQIELWDGYGGLVEGLKAGTYMISGEDTDYTTCGVCVMVYANGMPWPEEGEPQGDWYMATSGTVELTSVSGKLTGSLTNATLRHQVNPDLTGWVDADDGCTARVGTLTFDQTMVMETE
jgi:hypothetical protein